MKKKKYKYQWILEADAMKQKERKKERKKERNEGIHKKNKKLSLNNTRQLKSNQGNKYFRSFIIYSGPFLRWIKEELRNMEYLKMKSGDYVQGLHSRDGINRLHVTR